MNKPILKGICTAAITPFTRGETLDEAAITQFCQFQVESGVHGLFVNGSTAEFAAMPVDMQKKAMEMYVRHLNGRTTVVVHTGSARIDEAVELAEFAAGLNVDGLASVPPFFYNYDLESLKEYYGAIAGAAPGLPLYVYNFPAAAKNDITPDILVELRKAVPAIAGIKDTSQDYCRFIEYVDRMGPDFCVMMGSDAMVLGALVIGGSGAVSAAAASFPELMVDIYNAWLNQDLEKARRLQLIASRLRLIFGKTPVQARRKAALQLRGFKSQAVMSPGRTLTDAEFTELKQQLEQLEERFGYFLLNKVNLLTNRVD